MRLKALWTHHSIASAFLSGVEPLPTRLVSTLDGVLLIKYCFFLDPFRMGLTYPHWVLGCYDRLSSLLFFTNFFLLAFVLALLVELNPSFLIGALAWFFKITKVAFKSVDAFCKDLFLVLYLLSFHPWSSCIFIFFCQLLSLCWRPVHSPLTHSLLRQRLPKELWFDRSAGVFLSIWANARPFSQCILTKLISTSIPL